MSSKAELVRVGVYTSELHMEKYMRLNEKKSILSGRIGIAIHNLILGYCKK